MSGQDFRKFKPTPPADASTLTSVNYPDYNTESGNATGAIIGAVLTIIFLIICLLVFFYFRSSGLKRSGNYHTNEASGAEFTTEADKAIQFGKTGQPVMNGGELYI